MVNSLPTIGVPGLEGGANPLIALLRTYVDDNNGVMWDIQDKSGTTITAYPSNVYDGTYTGVTLNQAGPAGTVAGLWDGANDNGDIYSADLNTLLDRDKGTLLLFAQFDAGVWIDGSNRQLAVVAADGNNQLQVLKISTNNLLRLRYEANNAGTALVNLTMSPTGFFMVGMTWNTVADEMKAYLNGAQTGGTKSGLDVWAGNLDNTTCVIGASTTAPALVTDGRIALVTLLTEVLPAADMLTIAQLGGVA